MGKRETVKIILLNCPSLIVLCSLIIATSLVWANPEAMDQFNPSEHANCQEDADCQLIDQELGWSCCWAGRCAQVDYSLNRYLAVNKDWFEKESAKRCPPKNGCGPAPMCASRFINTSFEARCLNTLCQKVAK